MRLLTLAGSAPRSVRTLPPGTGVIDYLPAARVGDQAICLGPTDMIVSGTTSCLIGGRPAARLGDPTAHGGVIVAGCPTVLIGGGT